VPNRPAPPTGRLRHGSWENERSRVGTWPGQGLFIWLSPRTPTKRPAGLTFHSMAVYCYCYWIMVTVTEVQKFMDSRHILNKFVSNFTCKLQFFPVLGLKKYEKNNPDLNYEILWWKTFPRGLVSKFYFKADSGVHFSFRTFSFAHFRLCMWSLFLYQRRARRCIHYLLRLLLPIEAPNSEAVICVQRFVEERAQRLLSEVPVTQALKALFHCFAFLQGNRLHDDSKEYLHDTPPSLCDDILTRKAPISRPQSASLGHSLAPRFPLISVSCQHSS
jgi:hypothetical protein